MPRRGSPPSVTLTGHVLPTVLLPSSGYHSNNGGAAAGHECCVEVAATMSGAGVVQSKKNPLGESNHSFSRFMEDLSDLSDAPPSVRLTASLRYESSLSHASLEESEMMSLRSGHEAVLIPAASSPVRIVEHHQHQHRLGGAAASSTTPSHTHYLPREEGSAAGGVNSSSHCDAAAATAPRSSSIDRSTTSSSSLHPKEIESLLVHYFASRD